MIPDYYLNFELTFTVGDPIIPPIVVIQGGEATWWNLRREAIVDTIPRESTWNFLRSETTFGVLKYETTFNYLRSEITFYEDFIMANQDPFEISKGGKLVDQKIFLNPLRVKEDTLLSDETIVATQDSTGFTITNLRRNSSTLTNEDGYSFPANTVIIFDVEAPNDPDFDEALLYFEFTSTAGLNIKISHPIRVKEAIEAR